MSEKKELSTQELKDLINLIRLIVESQIRYVEVGFSVKEIASTFAEIYIREFEKNLTSKTAAKIKSGSLYQSNFNQHEAVVCYCLSLAGEIVAAVTKNMKKNRQ